VKKCLQRVTTGKRCEDDVSGSTKRQNVDFRDKVKHIKDVYCNHSICTRMTTVEQLVLKGDWRDCRGYANVKYAEPL